MNLSGNTIFITGGGFVEAAKALRANPGPQEHSLVNGFNQEMLKLFTPIQA
jgi:uncharacterized oxidoreductase